ncbi:hypothetical protein ACWPKS_17310 [Coraliomargarita sp. W4R72]
MHSLYDMQKDVTDEDLTQVGLHVVSLLRKKEFKKIEDEFGYAMRYGRPADKAIEEDLRRELIECGQFDGIDDTQSEIVISHYKQDDSWHLKSLIECYLRFSEEKGILVELMLTNEGSFYLEDISSFKPYTNE